MVYQKKYYRGFSCTTSRIDETREGLSQWISFKNDLGLCPRSGHYTALVGWVRDDHPVSEDCHIWSKSVCLPARTSISWGYLVSVSTVFSPIFFTMFFLWSLGISANSHRNIFLIASFFFFFCSDLGHIYYLYHRFHFTSCKLDIIGPIGKSSYFA